ncbi:MAG: UDP-N-acetylmuramoyl-L-alanyl-D-glutamate--2,6-diaminopimelate ligase [Pseudomonas sp.]
MIALQQVFPEWSAEPVMITDLTLDSRQVRPGSLFLAVPGLRTDGRQHIAAAVAAGAAAIAYESADGAHFEAPVPLLPVSGLAARLSELAGRFYQNPSAELGVVGITGTNGKTSVSQLLAQALTALGRPCGIIGTLGSGMPGQLLDHGMTTPDAVRVQQQLAALRDAGAQWVSMEVSSHALDQDRVAAVRFELAVFTNLSRDHLDYHGDMDTYAAAKARLFRNPQRAAVINLDDGLATRLLSECPARCLSYSLENQAADLYCTEVRFSPAGVQAQVHFAGQQVLLSSDLLGAFNLANLLAVLGCLLALDIPLEQAVQSLAQLQPPAGRMQRCGAANGPLVVVDYAHTPDALEKALAALRDHVQGQLICVLGCGGERDSGKRPLMGRIAEQYADLVVVTDDNPRGEDSSSIIEQILQGIERPEAIKVIANRAAAIQTSVAQALFGDVVLLAGKGHEDYQEINGVRHPFSDIEQAELALQQWEAKHA